MLSYCFKCRKNTESKNPETAKAKKWENQCFYQNVRCVAAKIQNLLKSKRQKGCFV